MIKNIIFDFDGTLVDSSQVVDKLFKYFLQKYRKDDVDNGQLERLKKLSVVQKFKEMGVPIYKLPNILLETRKIYSSYLKDINFVEGIPELLEKLNQAGEIGLSIVSSNSAKNIKQFLGLNKADFFSDIYSAPNLLKKGREIVKVIKKKKLDKKNVLYIGDEVNDIIACKNIQVQVLAVAWGSDSIHALKNSKPDHICYKPMDIYDYIYGGGAYTGS